MAGSFRGRTFSSSRSGGGLGEDVNPSAYIVNLADCMLVLACGFLVALVSAWGVSFSSTEIDSSQMSEVDPETIMDAASTEGSGYVEAGTVWMDPKTGIYYIVQTDDEAEAAARAAEGAK